MSLMGDGNSFTMLKKMVFPKSKKYYLGIGICILFAGFVYCYTTQQSASPSAPIMLTDIYITVPNDGSIDSLSLYAYSENTGTHTFVTSNKNINGTIHFAVRYHPHVTYILWGTGFPAYPCDFDQSTLRLDLNWNGDTITEAIKTDA